MKRRHIRSLFILSAILLFLPLAKAQKISTDSLKQLLSHSISNTAKLSVLNQLANAHRNNDPQTALDYGKQALQLAITLKNQDGMARAYTSNGVAYENQAYYKKALKSFLKAIDLFTQTHNNYMLAKVNNDLGILYAMQDNHDKAVSFFNKSLQIAESIHDTSLIALCNNNLGNMFYTQAFYTQTQGAVDSSKLFHEAITYYDRSKELYQLKHDESGLINSYNNLALIYTDLGNYDKAMAYLAQAVEHSKKLNDPGTLSYAYCNIGRVYASKDNYPKAISYYKKGLKIAKDLNDRNSMQDIYSRMGEAFYFNKDFKNAYTYLQLSSTLKDSILNEENSRQINEMQTRFESEKKEKEIELLKEKAAVQQLDLNRQKWITIAIGSGLVLLTLLMFFIYKNYREKKAANLVLEHQKNIIEEKNKDITNSIHYAQRIQEAMLPLQENIAQAFRDFFILFLPRDVVSGDFYWFTEKHNMYYIAAVDCTGHGVPGAFMSMIGNSLLNEIVNNHENKQMEAGKLLDELSRGIVSALKQTGAEGENKDGMDISLCIFDKEKETLQFAGANNPLYLVRNGQLQITKGNKQPIGIFQGTIQPFTTHRVELSHGDHIYLFSDGYADQFGGDDGKKFKTKHLQKLLVSVSEMNMSEQKEVLRDNFLTWKGKLSQIDDVLIIGIQV